LADPLEGSSRPGHFRGVATVVAKLFGAMQPNVAVFGQKDFQQLVIIRRMVADLDIDIEIVAVPTVREPDGLAVSSRNHRLGADDRRASVCLVEALREVASAVHAGERDVEHLVGLAGRRIAAEPRAALEYIRVVDPVTLDPVSAVDQHAVILVAARFGDVRLIDNMALIP
jgi:pantoate--beta-alanine ligase